MTLLELALEAGLNPKWAASTQGGEYKSSCPNCGGIDRFFIQPNRQMSRCKGYYFCRRCEIKGDALKFSCDILRISIKEAKDRIGFVDQYFFRGHKKDFKKTNKLVLPSSTWLNCALIFTEWSHKKLFMETHIIEYLEKRGISFSTIIKYKLGYCPENICREREKWGLPPKESAKKIWLAKGIVIPTFNNNQQVVRIKIRREDHLISQHIPKYIAIPGSMNGLNIIGDTNKELMIVIESELDGYALYSSIGDFAFIVAVGSNIKNPDNITDFLAQQKNKLLICYDNDEAGYKMLVKWKKLYPHAKGLNVPYGKDIGEYFENGGNIRELILKYKF